MRIVGLLLAQLLVTGGHTAARRADSRTVVRAWCRDLPALDDGIVVATLVEDGAKLIGTWLWKVWIVLAAVATTRPMVVARATELRRDGGGGGAVE